MLWDCFDVGFFVVVVVLKINKVTIMIKVIMMIILRIVDLLTRLSLESCSDKEGMLRLLTVTPLPHNIAVLFASACPRCSWSSLCRWFNTHTHTLKDAPHLPGSPHSRVPNTRMLVLVMGGGAGERKRAD